MKSLVAEDDATNRMLLQTFLSRYGECDIALNGKDAVEAIRIAREEHSRFDLVCMDLRMPEMDGLEAIREIRRQEHAAGMFSRVVKIIVTTGLTDGKNVNEALKGGCDGYLLKPIDTEVLLERLKTLGLVR
jgi:two-component system chemotaxis response regulator CheY